MNSLRRTFRLALLPFLLLRAAASSPPNPFNAPLRAQYQILHSFQLNSLQDGGGPQGQLVFDPQGNLYGATRGGGPNVNGIVYELSPGANGQWTETILYSFPGYQGDGENPTGVVIDSVGNLYGTTTSGGSKNHGTVFELARGAGGLWTETTLYNFCSLPNCADGGNTEAEPTLNPSGGLFGLTTAYPGTAYQLTPGESGWVFTLLYTFCSQPNCTDGDYPVGSLALDVKGNLYGDTSSGGSCKNNLGCGLVFTLRPQPDGQWQETVLQIFGTNQEGTGVTGGITIYRGALFGTTGTGGDYGCLSLGCGTIFQLTRGAKSPSGINERLIHQFGENGAEGNSPYLTVTFDSNGQLFGITTGGGSPVCDCGIVYGMKVRADGKLGFAVLHTFIRSDGMTPDSTLTLDREGNLYGTTGGGGPGDAGVAFELSPVN